MSVSNPASMRRRGRELTEDERSQLGRRFLAGESERSLAREFGIARKSVSLIVRPLKQPQSLRVLSDRQLADARSLREAGWTWKALGEHFGVHLTTVWRAIQGSDGL